MKLALLPSGLGLERRALGALGIFGGLLMGAHDRLALSGAGADAVLGDVTALRGVLSGRDLLPLVTAS